jgi:hypothetical protein
VATVLSHTGAFANALAIVGKFQVKPAIEGLPTSKLSSNAAWIFVDLRGSLWIFVDLGWWIFRYICGYFGYGQPDPFRHIYLRAGLIDSIVLSMNQQCPVVSSSRLSFLPQYFLLSDDPDLRRRRLSTFSD